MGGVCERPGCSRIAAAAVAVDPRRGIVWIGDLESSTGSVNALCALHADGLSAPVGWQRRDVRETPRLFAVPSAAPEPTPPRPRRSTRRANQPATGADAVAQRLDAVATTATAARVGSATPVRATSAATAPAPTQRVGTGSPARGARAATAPSAAAERAANPTLAELHRVGTELSAATAALLSTGGDTPLLARAFRTSRAAG